MNGGPCDKMNLNDQLAKKLLSHKGLLTITNNNLVEIFTYVILIKKS